MLGEAGDCGRMSHIGCSCGLTPCCVFFGGGFVIFLTMNLKQDSEVLSETRPIHLPYICLLYVYTGINYGQLFKNKVH